MSNKKTLTKVQRNWLLGVGTACTVGLAALTYSALTQLLMKETMDREEPKVMQKAKKQIAGSLMATDVLERCTAASEQLRNASSEVIKITSGYDGVDLIGHWYPAEDAKRVLICMHGWRSSWDFDFGLISGFFHENGCSLLIAEQRGQSASGGDYMGFGMVERFDTLDWAMWVKENKSLDLPIYLVGVSMGAATVMMASDLGLPEQVHGIMADCGYTSADAIWRHVMKDNLHLDYGLRGNIVADICRKKYQIDPKACSTTEALKNSRIPLLLIHGTDDHFVPVTMTYENYKACRAPKRLLIIHGAEHAMSYIVDQKGYENAVLKFWRDFDTYVFPEEDLKEDEEKCQTHM